MSLPIAAVLLAAVVLPHLLNRDRLIPSTGIALWTAVLALRAILVISAALTLVLYLPATQIFHLLTSWCLHAVLPFFATHLGLSGHGLGEMATLVPALALALSLIVAVFSLWRAAQRVRSWLRGNAVGSGPGESVIVVEPEVMLAAAGVRKARVIVSSGALLALDESELNAGLEHERGHIKRHHSYISALAGVLYALARGLPGTRRVQGQLTFYLERDADEYAIKRTGDPLALAAAICKSRRSLPALPSVAFATLSGAGAPRRLRLLLNRGARQPNTLISVVGILFTVLALALTMVLLVELPGLIHGGVIAMAHAPAGPFCPD